MYASFTFNRYSERTIRCSTNANLSIFSFISRLSAAIHDLHAASGSQINLNIVNIHLVQFRFIFLLSLFSLLLFVFHYSLCRWRQGNETNANARIPFIYVSVLRSSNACIGECSLYSFPFLLHTIFLSRHLIAFDWILLRLLLRKRCFSLFLFEFLARLPNPVHVYMPAAIVYSSNAPFRWTDSSRTCATGERYAERDLINVLLCRLRCIATA